MAFTASSFVLRPAWPERPAIDHRGAVETTPLAVDSELPPSLGDEDRALQAMARMDDPVLITGEAGTGKTFIARRLHGLRPHLGSESLRFLGFDGAAVTAGMLTSWCEGATLYIKGVDALSADAQRALRTELSRQSLDASRPGRPRPRLLASTAVDLAASVAREGFDAELFHRLSTMSFDLRPLRERRIDVTWFAERWLQEFDRQTGRGVRLGPAARKALQSCAWPGNLHQLRGCVLRHACASPGGCIKAIDCERSRCLSAQLGRHPAEPPVAAASAAPTTTAAALPQTDGNLEAVKSTRIISRERLIDALEQSGWVQAQAARRLQLTPRQIGYAIRQHGIEIRRL